MTNTIAPERASLPHFDVREIPFSRRGAWLDLSPVIGLHTTATEIHLVSHQTGMHPVLTMRPSLDGLRLEAETRADAASLRWETASGTVEAVFEKNDTLRVRGSAQLGFDLIDAAPALTPFTGTFLYRDPIDDSAVFTSYETGRRYRVTSLSGTLECVGAGALGISERSVHIASTSAEPWEFVVEEFETGRKRFRPKQSFDAVRADVEREFHAFLDAVAPWRDERTPAAALAAYVLWSATVAPGGFLRRESVLMSKHWMDKVWSWDHCFNALALAPGLPELALDQFLAPFDHQDQSGAMPDSVAHSETLYNFVKPPIHGWAYTLLREAGLEFDVTQKQEIFERLSRWTRFWLDERRVPGRRLPYYTHGNDSGWDNSTAFDHDRVIESPDLAAFLVIQLKAIAELAAELGADPTEWECEADNLRAALREELWRGDGFVARGVLSGQDSKRSSLLTLLPIIAGVELGEDVSLALAAGIRQHLTEWGPATQLVSSPEYLPDGYWRGPIWAPSTLIVESGLRRSGDTATADRISEGFRRLCEHSGFAENFDALTGQGLRDRAYTWTASVYLILARDALRRSDLPSPDPTDAARAVE